MDFGITAGFSGTVTDGDLAGGAGLVAGSIFSTFAVSATRSFVGALGTGFTAIIGLGGLRGMAVGSPARVTAHAISFPSWAKSVVTSGCGFCFAARSR